MRYSMILSPMLLCQTLAAPAQVSVGINLPGLSIGINQPAYPDLVLVPGYPVYYVPGSPMNYFFYDGLYWVYQNNEWYSSEWYNGPWALTDPYAVPLFLLRVPVRYYCQPPPYFARWDRDAPPRWGEHWGQGWEQRRRGWDHWDRGAAPAPAPLPVYQRRFSGGSYPGVAQQRQLHAENYRYEPREAVVRERYRQQPVARPSGPNPPLAQHQPPTARPGHLNPPAPPYQQPPPRPSHPSPPEAHRPLPEPAPLQNHEVQHANPNENQRRLPPKEPAKSG